MGSWVDILEKRLIDAGVATPDTIAGCSEEELSDIESAFKLKLPGAYKDYMRKFGKASGAFLEECGIYYPNVLRNRERAETLLANNTDYRLKPADFVFVTTYGYQFHFFNTESGRPNPPVLRYTETNAEPINLADSFEHAIEMAAEEYFALVKNPLLEVPSRFSD